MPPSSSSGQKLPRPMTPPGAPPPSAARTESKLSFGVVCSSNINRSMEAHVVLGNAGKNAEASLCVQMCIIYFTPCVLLFIVVGLRVESYGTGTNVRYVNWIRRSRNLFVESLLVSSSLVLSVYLEDLPWNLKSINLVLPMNTCTIPCLRLQRMPCFSLAMEYWHFVEEERQSNRHHNDGKI